jgi:parvulin-like peptidyl-prolyl isomerase
MIQVKNHVAHRISRLFAQLTLAAAFSAAPSMVSAQPQVLDQVVAIVDDDIILASELRERVESVRANLEGRGVEVPSDDILVRETLDRLILDSIQLQLASRYAATVSRRTGRQWTKLRDGSRGNPG